MIRTFLVAVLLTASLLAAAPEQPSVQINGVGASVIEVKIEVKKKVVTWKGKVFIAGKVEKFSATIDPFNAKMTVGKETRYFEPGEAAHSIQHFGWVIQYITESTIWWKLGMGSKVPVVAPPPKNDDSIVLGGDGK